MATVEMKLKPWIAPNYALVERPPALKQDGFKELPSIPVAELSAEALTQLAQAWLTDLYHKANKVPNWSFSEPPMTPPPVAEPAAWLSDRILQECAQQPEKYHYALVRGSADKGLVNPVYSEATLSAETAARVKAEGDYDALMAGTHKLFAAQNEIMDQVWDILVRDETREGGQNLVQRVGELRARAEKAEGERDEARAGRAQLINDTVQMGLARDDAERRADKAETRVRELEEALSGPAAWLERWATHIGSCRGGSVCTCGLTLARHEIAATLLADGQPKP